MLRRLVQANDSEWLPTGWVIERRIRKSGARVGTEYKCFIDPSSGAKFFSKPEVLRHLKCIAGNAGSSRGKDKGGSRKSSSKRLVEATSSHKSNSEPKTSQILKTPVRNSLSSRKRKVVIERTADEGLPPGWIKEMRIKMLGDKIIRRDPFFLDPASSLVFRSKLEVLRYVETGEISRHAYHRRNQNVIGEDSAVGTTSTSSAKRKETTDSKIRKQRFAKKGCSEQSIQALTETGDNEESGSRKHKYPIRVRRPPSASVPNRTTVSPESTSNSQVANPLLDKDPAIRDTVGMIRFKPPEVQEADVKDAIPQKSESSSPSRGVLPEENPVGVAIQNGNTGKAQTGKRKAKGGKMPSRSSKRLAGVDAEVLYLTIPIEHALRSITRKPSRTKPIPSLASIPVELQKKDQDVDSNKLIVDALQATSKKSFSTVESVLNECHEHQVLDMQNELASREVKHDTVDVKTLPAAQAEKPLNKVDDPKFQEEKHSTLDFEAKSVLCTNGEQPSNNSDNLKLQEEQRRTLDVDLETVLSTQKPLNKIDHLPFQEKKLSFDMNTVFDMDSVDNFVRKDPILVDLNDLQLEAPPGFSGKTKVQSITTKQSLEHSMGNLLKDKVETVPKGKLILEERSQEKLASSQTEQPQSEFGFSAPLWSDPCLDFAFKTLTGAIPFDDNLAIQDYIQYQSRTSEPPAQTCAPSCLKNNETKAVSQLPEDVNFPNSNGFGSSETKQVKNK
ncbi:uncharacterized protein LOC130804822 isoform X2 [Amaranthus tricolor]|uniref:uncharacterized protein LOC130804822 isoform X2 n=1 Tax=Amaranthus tricolor TaxID=29722 RepID=UPI00258B243E|nr:uncharacterized protein LOC130804822 isoform X2 [Amaranthus tricolor]